MNMGKRGMEGEGEPQKKHGTVRMSLAVSLISPPSPLSSPFHRTPTHFLSSKILNERRVTCRPSPLSASAASPAPPAPDADPHTTTTASPSPSPSASEVVRTFYGGINAQNISSIQHLIAQNCVYEDLVFPRPFIGRTAILEFFKQFTASTSTDLQFVIDDISTEDSSVVGVTWHLEWKGRPFPFSKGCSFYRLEVIDGKRQIVYGRDCVEPAIKPGEAVLAAIKGVTWLLQQFPQLADQL